MSKPAATKLQHYQEAATLYLNHVNNKVKAGECYENGNITMEAINLHVELNDHEKVGDLYVTISIPRQWKSLHERINPSDLITS